MIQKQKIPRQAENHYQKFAEFNYNKQTFADVLFIFGDVEDNIWFGGSKGIWKFDGKTLSEISTKE